MSQFKINKMNVEKIIKFKKFGKNRYTLFLNLNYTITENEKSTRFQKI
jgi:hypothetical protein